MNEFTCTKRSNDNVFFCYSCLKAGADGSRVWGGGGVGGKAEYSFTVQYLVSITSPKGDKQANSSYAARKRQKSTERIYLEFVQVEIYG